jgi:hypothetical protein
MVGGHKSKIKDQRDWLNAHRPFQETVLESKVGNFKERLPFQAREGAEVYLILFCLSMVGCHKSKIKNRHD